ncbi:MAG: site-2 protease family protein [Gemmataceae bacterium]
MDKQQASDQSGRIDAGNSISGESGESLNIVRWLRSNSILLFLIVAGAIAFFYYVEDPFEQAWSWAKAALGLGFIIFIHELGHFAVAKWCDVHVETFSVGFGPAIPGCSFRKGETLYKLALIPLGGYVKMVGEGTEEEGDEDNPRSFKNKPVGQRMAIISAGVIMNIITGCIFFVAAYESGVERRAAVIGAVEVNSPAWKKGLREGDVIEQIGRVAHPFFEDLQYEVMLSDKGEQLAVATWQPGEKPRQTTIMPRRDSNDSRPVIGIIPVNQLKLLPREAKRVRPSPVRLVSAAAYARQLELREGDQILSTTDPSDRADMLPLPASDKGVASDFMEFSRRLEKLKGESVKVQIKRKGGKKEELNLLPEPFDFDDDIVAATDASASNNPYDPYRIKDLEVDPRDPEGKNLDYFDFTSRMKRLAGKPIVIRVRRGGRNVSAELADIFVPPAYYYTIPGASMEIGAVAGTRDNSPAEQAGVKVNDVINRVKLSGMRDGKPDSMTFTTSPAKDKEGAANSITEVLDPMRLPFELKKWADGRTNVKAAVTVYRLNSENHNEKELQTLKEVSWQPEWEFDEELSIGLASPLAIPELGLAYQVKTTIADVVPGSIADKAGLRRSDVIWEITFQRPEKNGNATWSKTNNELWTVQDGATADDKEKAEPYWPSVFTNLQLDDFKKVKLLVKRAGEKDKTSIEVNLEPDPSWPIDDRGLSLIQAQTRLQKASSFGEACSMGLNYTYQMINKTYQGLKSMITGRISFQKSVSGPITIAAAAQHFAGKDMVSFLLFLGLISVNLAVVNFLPIPVLDGGHMVFLIYEKVRGKPASERVREVLTYAGVALIISLMLVVSFIDVKRLWQAW